MVHKWATVVISLVVGMLFVAIPCLQSRAEEADEEADTAVEETLSEEESDSDEGDAGDASLLFDETPYAIEIRIEGNTTLSPFDEYLSEFTIDYILNVKTSVLSLQHNYTVDAQAQIESTVTGALYDKDIICNLTPEIADIEMRIMVSPQMVDDSTGARRIQVKLQGLDAITETWWTLCPVNDEFSLATAGEKEKLFADLIKASEPPLTSLIASEHLGAFKQEVYGEYANEEDPVYLISGTLKGEITLFPEQ